MNIRRLFTVLAFIPIFGLSQARNADEVTPLLIGSNVPRVSVSDETGTEQFLPSLTKGKYTILVFYRGGWCPYCNTHMQELAAAESGLVALGYQIIGVSPDSSENLASIEKDGEIHYALYSDSDLKAAEAFGIDFTLGKATLLKYKGFGINLEKQSGGKNKNRLPVPSVFIITPDNKVAFAYVNPDYTQRVPGDLLLAAAKALKD